MVPSANLCILGSLPGLCLGCQEHPSLPRLALKQLTEGARCSLCPLLGSWGTGWPCVVLWVPLGLAPAVGLHWEMLGVPSAPWIARSCARRRARQRFCSCHPLSAVTLRQLLLLVPLRAFNWPLLLIGGRSFRENCKFVSGSF